MSRECDIVTDSDDCGFSVGFGPVHPGDAVPTSDVFAVVGDRPFSVGDDVAEVLAFLANEFPGGLTEGPQG